MDSNDQELDYSETHQQIEDYKTSIESLLQQEGETENSTEIQNLLGNIARVSFSILQVAETQANHIKAIDYSNNEMEKQLKTYEDSNQQMQDQLEQYENKIAEMERICQHQEETVNQYQT